VRRADADAQLDLLARIESAGKNDWRSAAWILEHRYKSDFGQALDVTTGGEKVTFEIVEIPSSVTGSAPEAAPVPEQPGQEESGSGGQAGGQDDGDGDAGGQERDAGTQGA